MVLKELGYKEIKEVIINGKWKLFNKKVCKRLKDLGNVEYYYKAYCASFVSIYLADTDCMAGCNLIIDSKGSKLPALFPITLDAGKLSPAVL